MLKDIDPHQISKPLLMWYSKNARKLPWREEVAPYRVWVSEIMLQQTRVEAVKPYFARFMEALPTIEALSLCDEEKLLKLWEGLGYYNRVRNMQKAAVMIMEEYEGEMPADYEELLKLPGIGPYTAGAVASIAYGLPAPAVDGNVFRVMTRLTADDTDIKEASFRKQVERLVVEAMPRDKCGEFNQALMELGATVCLPNGTPLCTQCPLHAQCLAHKMEREADFPVKTKERPRKIEKKTVLVIRDGSRILLTKRPGKGLLAGMYEFPVLEGYASDSDALKAVQKIGLQPLHIQKIEDAKHVFTHKEWHMRGYMIRVAQSEKDTFASDGKDYFLIEAEKTEERYPIPAAYATYMRYMDVKVGNEKYHKMTRDD